MVDKGIPVRLVLYSVGIVYLVADLFVFGGPLKKAVFRKRPNSPEVIEAAKREGVAARVYFQPILLTQIDRRVEEELWKEGRLPEEVGVEERKLLRLAAVNDLIDLHLLRIKARYNAREHPVVEEEVEAELERFTKRFANEAEFRESLQRRGWSEKELRMRLAARLQQQDYLQSMIEVEVSEEEARRWYAENREALSIPDRIRARHVFLATLDREEAVAKRQIEEAKHRLETGVATFGELALEMSDDPRTKGEGGDLGWLQEQRVAEDLAARLFAAEVKKPVLVRTKIGWHLAEVTERKDGRERSYEEAHAEILAALEAVKRDRGIRLYREQLRRMEGGRVEIFHDILEQGLAEAPEAGRSGEGESRE